MQWPIEFLECTGQSGSINFGRDEVMPMKHCRVLFPVSFTPPTTTVSMAYLPPSAPLRIC
jgi:hypothetical protein